MNYLEVFYDYLKANYYKKNTINCYKFHLEKVNSYFKSINIIDEKNINEKLILDYVKHLNDNKTLSVYFERFLKLKTYFQFLENSKIIFINPAKNIKAPKMVRNRISVVPLADLLDCLNKLKTVTDTDIKSKAVFELLYSTGIRPFELTNIKIKHLDFNKNELFIEKGKIDKDRVVPVGDTALFWTQKYLTDIRPKYLKNKSLDYLFINSKHRCGKLTTTDLYNLANSTFKKNKIKRFKPYSFRSSCSTHCLLNGMDIMHIKKLLGHNSINVTKGYLHVDLYDLKKVLDKNHPRNKF